MNALKSTILVIILLSLILISACSEQPKEVVEAKNIQILKVIPSDHKPTNVLYEVYTLDLGRSARIDSIYIRKDNYVDNQSYLLNGSLIKLFNQGIVNNFFSVNIEYRNKTGRSYIGVTLRDVLIPLGNSVEIKKWEVNETRYIEYLVVEEIDFNKTSYDWNYIKVTVALYNETMPIPVVPEPAIEIKEIPFETISKGSSSGHEERGAYVIMNSGNWSSLVRKVRVRVPLPEIDFGKEMVMAVFQGTFGSGHGIEISKLIEKEDSLEVFVRENDKENVMPVVTRPYHIIKTAKSWKKVIFPEGNFVAVKSEYHEPIRILRVNETQTFTIQTRDYEVTITEISGMPLKAEFTLNGEAFELGKGEAYETRGGTKVKVHNVTKEFVEFELLP